MVAQILQRRRRQFGIGLHASGGLGLLEWMIEQRAIDIEHDAAVHRDEAAIAVVREAFVVRDLGETLDAVVVETKVEDSVHHPGHRELGTRAHRNQQRIACVAQPATHRLF